MRKPGLKQKGKLLLPRQASQKREGKIARRGKRRESGVSLGEGRVGQGKKSVRAVEVRKKRGKLRMSARRTARQKSKKKQKKVEGETTVSGKVEIACHQRKR